MCNCFFVKKKKNNQSKRWIIFSSRDLNVFFKKLDNLDLLPSFVTSQFHRKAILGNEFSLFLSSIIFNFNYLLANFYPTNYQL